MKTPIRLALALALALLLPVFAVADKAPTYWDLYEKARTALKAGDHRTYAANMKLAIELLPAGDPNRATSLYELARGQALAGEPEASLATLVRLWDEKAEAPLVFFADTDAAFAAVRALPGFRALLGRVGEIQLQVIPVKGSLYRIEGAGCTLAASIGPDGILLVDTGYGALADNVREALRKLAPNAPVRFLVNTHHHEDHSGGNARFASEAEVIGHSAARAELSRPHYVFDQTLPGRPEAGLPTLTTDRAMTIHFNGEEVRILPLPSHTVGDLAVIFTGSGVAHLGDTYFRSDPTPLLDPGKDVDAFLKNMEEVLRQIPEGSVVLTGHEPPVTGTDDLRTRVKNTRLVVDFLRARIAAGERPETIKADLPFPLPGPWLRFLYGRLTSRP
ncbi:MAG: cyclase [Acidobacteriota bacterium]|jgi:glyoxylase-like metal-dependent hydrolase (beta-lactamase superfamily II)|nr:cyclase [Acidobacteriota bacterium]